MYDHTLSKLANHQIRCQATHKVSCQSGDLHMVTLIFLRGLCGYVWINILTLSPPRVGAEWGVLLRWIISLIRGAKWGLGLSCLMTPGLSKDTWCHV